MRAFALILTILLCVAGASAQRLYFDEIILRSPATAVTADTALGTVDVSQAEQVIVSFRLDTLGGSGTYCPMILSSVDGTDWDTLRIDTLTAAGQSCILSQGISNTVALGCEGNTVAGASTAQLYIGRYLKGYIDEIGASTGSDLTFKIIAKYRRHKDQ